MKVISYSLFGDPSSFEFPFYLRGIYFNARMNKLIYPEWTTVIHVENSIYGQYDSFLESLAESTRTNLVLLAPADLCKAMLWRMKPIYSETIQPTHVICRDADAITTYKEAQAVNEWVDSRLGFHGITDNPAHTLPMMGGMVGFEVESFRNTFPMWTCFEEMVKRQDLSKHGSDQDLIMKKIYPKAKDNMVGHFFSGCKEIVRSTRHSVIGRLLGVDAKLWEADLTCRHIGSAGVVEMELLRFFQRFDKTDYSAFEKEFSEICYWAR